MLLTWPSLRGAIRCYPWSLVTAHRSRAARLAPNSKRCALSSSGEHMEQFQRDSATTTAAHSSRTTMSRVWERHVGTSSANGARDLRQRCDHPSRMPRLRAYRGVGPSFGTLTPGGDTTLWMPPPRACCPACEPFVRQCRRTRPAYLEYSPVQYGNARRRIVARSWSYREIGATSFSGAAAGMSPTVAGRHALEGGKPAGTEISAGTREHRESL